MEKKVRKEFTFDDDNALRILSLAGKKQSDLIKAALIEFFDKYGIEESITKKEMQKFINIYPYLRQITKNQGAPILLQGAPPIQPASAQTVNEKPADEEDPLEAIFQKNRGANAGTESLDDGSDIISERQASAMADILKNFMHN